MDHGTDSELEIEDGESSCHDSEDETGNNAGDVSPDMFSYDAEIERRENQSSRDAEINNLHRYIC